MEDIPRKLADALQSTQKSVLILGPRQVGKSTLLRSMKPDCVVNLASEREYFKFATEPGRLESILEAEKPQRVLVDEIQRLPSLLNSVQYWVDSQGGAASKTQFLLSGSSARKLKRGEANLAPGRLRVFHLGGLVSSELHGQLDCPRALSRGTLPEPYLTFDPMEAQAHLRDYSATYLKEEIQAEALTRNLSGFSRFLLVLAAQSGNILDLSKVSSKAKVSRTSALRFIEILEDTLIAARVPSHRGLPQADVVSHPKLYFFDVGVLNGLLENFTISADRVGRLMEHLVYSQLQHSLWACQRPGIIEYFRTRHGVEVDFLVTLGNDERWAIEVKSGTVQESDLDALLRFRNYLPSRQRKSTRLAVVSLQEGSKRLKHDCSIMGLNELLREMQL